jgi:hypothetical protein
MAECIAKIKEDSSTSNKDELRLSTSFYADSLYSGRQSNLDIVIQPTELKERLINQSSQKL